MAKTPSATRKSSRNRNKGKVSSSIFIDSDSDDLFPASIASSLGKLPDDSFKCGSSKKKFEINFDSSLDKKVNFWNSSHESLFHYLKDKAFVYGRVVDLDLLSSLDCHIKKLFVFQGWAKIFYVPMVVYEPPNDVPFDTRVISHSVATTLLPRAGSHSTLNQRDTLFAYCWVSGIKVHVSSFILSAMTDVICDPSILPFGMLITRIFESHFMCLGDFSLVLIKQRYNSHSFLSMGFTRSDSSWVLKIDEDDLAAAPVKSKPSSSTSVSTAKLNAALENLVEMYTKLDVVTITLSTMSEQVDSLKDLMLSAHFKIDSVKHVTKETCADVARNRVRMNQIVTEAIKISTNDQTGSKAFSTSLSSKFEKM
ncbi:hypothetical protein H5410_036924 [Solanum commersonii]|uniref:Uncharacterized protein n=1 Tax=Solanum commersonii TaxID=4109 RepID=A0A9J5Y8T6_SOLCO|nr:hypothetical protein H5410_036924 [Solanum commersonii]